MVKKIFLFVLFSSLIIAQEIKISGIVFNEETNEPIPYVSIRIAGTSQGTSSNYEGKFILTISKLKAKLSLSVVGYRKKDFIIDNFENIKIGMKPEPIQFMEIVVGVDEDPAYRIIREAIKRKKENKAGLNSLEYNFFSKDIFLSAGKVAMVSEKFSNGYYKIGKPEKVITYSVHITENEKKNALSFNQNILDKSYVDFTEDTLMIIGNKVFLPLAANAFDWYDYKLLEVKQSGSVHECYIAVIPRSNIQPLLKGKIVIEDSTYSLKNIQLSNGEGLRFPYVNDLKIELIQNRDRYGKYFLPTYFKVESSLRVSFAGLIGIDEISMNQVNMFTNYKINPVIPDSIYNLYATVKTDTTKNLKVKFVQAKQLTRAEIDSLRPIPLTKNELQAYKELDSTKSVVSQIQFTGLLSGVAKNAVDRNSSKDNGNSFFSYIGTFFEYFNFRNNRVDGILIGAKYNHSFFGNSLSFSGNLGYAFARKNYEWNLSSKINLKWGIVRGINFEVFDEARQWQILNPYPDILNSANVLAGFDDHFNFQRSRGFSFGFINYFGSGINSTLSFGYERQESLPELKYQSIFAANRLLKLNPKIYDGIDAKISYGLLMGTNPQIYQPLINSGLIFQFDISNPLLSSDFNYKRIKLIGQLTTKTMYSELFSAPYLLLGFEVYAVFGNYGPQHVVTPDVALNIYSPFLTFKGLNTYEYVGNKLLAFHAEHNWRTIPFQMLGLDFMTDQNIDVITGFNLLKMWNESNYFTNNSLNDIYWETYFSLAKIFGIGRIDFTYCQNKKFVVRIGLSTVL